MDRAQFLQQLHEVFEAEPGTITGSCPLKAVPGWDSLTFLGLIAMIDERCGMVLAPEQILACPTVEDLIALVTATAARRAA